MRRIRLGSARETFMRLIRLLVAFVVIRILEAAWILLSFVLVSAVTEQVTASSLLSWNLGDALSGGLTLARYYYLAFGYLVTSAVVFLVAGTIGCAGTARSIAITSLLAYLAHSIVVIVAAFDGVLPPSLWAMWILIGLYNAFLTGPIAGRLGAHKSR